MIKLKKNRKFKRHEIKTTQYVSKHFSPIDKTSIDWNEFEKKYDEVQRKMKTEHLWFEDGHNYYFRSATHKKIILGRCYYYVQFSDFMYEKYNQRYYLLDFMTRLEGLNGQDSLLYFIEEAEEIQINLEGVSRKHLKKATIGLNRLTSDKGEIGADYTTAWEINQVFHKGLLNITWFHTGSSMTKRQAYNAMGRRVPIERISDDNRGLASKVNSNIIKKEYEELEAIV